MSCCLIDLRHNFFFSRVQCPSDRTCMKCLFIQNYHFGIWTHTWSLAVEEHFYIALALLFVDFDTNLPGSGQSISSYPLGLRHSGFHVHLTEGSYDWAHAPSIFRTGLVMNATHCRIDGLFFGVFIGYLYHFRPDGHRNPNPPAEQPNRDRNSNSGPTIDLLLLFARRSFPPQVRTNVSLSGVWWLVSAEPRSAKRTVG